MVVFTLFFGSWQIFQPVIFPIHFSVLLLSISWTLFAEGLNRSTTSMVHNAGIMTKVYFPTAHYAHFRYSLTLIDFTIAFMMLILMMAYYGYVPTIAIVLLPLFILLALMTSLAVGLWFSALNIKYRDFQYTIPLSSRSGSLPLPLCIHQACFPVLAIYLFIESYGWGHWRVPMGAPWDETSWSYYPVYPWGVVAILLIGGLYYFKRMSSTLQMWCEMMMDFFRAWWFWCQMILPSESADLEKNTLLVDLRKDTRHFGIPSVNSVKAPFQKVDPKGLRLIQQWILGS